MSMLLAGAMMVEQGGGPTPSIPLDYIARYLFNSDYTDETGNYDGTNSGSTFVGLGNGPNGTDFGISTGNGSFVTLPTGLISALGGGAGTVSCVVKTAASTNVARIINASNNGTNTNFCVFNFGNGSSLFINGGGPTSSNAYRGNAAGTTNQWEHVIIRTDGASTSFRLNGANQTTVVTSGSDVGAFFDDVSGSNSLIIGKLDRLSDLNGSVFELAFLTLYGRELSDSECAQLEAEY